MRLKDAEREVVRLKGSVAVQRTRRERAEAVVESLASWVVKLSDLLRGEFHLCLVARFRLVGFAVSILIVVFDFRSAGRAISG